MNHRGLLNKHFCRKKILNNCSETAKIANVHFSHYKSMETISCHSNQSSNGIGTKNIIYVEANVINIYAKYQLHPSYGF